MLNFYKNKANLIKIRPKGAIVSFAEMDVLGVGIGQTRSLNCTSQDHSII